MVLPLGISFFTFTQIAYLVDVHAGKVIERNPIHYALFVTYFPHLIAGPVLHHAEMMPQFRLAAIYQPYLRNFAIGLTFLLLGPGEEGAGGRQRRAARELGVRTSDPRWRWRRPPHGWASSPTRCRSISIFPATPTWPSGLSLLFGVRLPYNFNSPYQAWNITEFWRRWHMTLSRFLRDYLYVPLGGNRRGRARRYVNLMLTMLLGGLWHGASWTFVVWGGLHGAYLVVNHGWQWLKEKSGWGGKAMALGWIGRAAGVALTLLCVMIGWVFFRAPDVASAAGILRSMFGLAGDGLPPGALAGYSHGLVAWIAGFSLLALFGRNSQRLIDGRMTRWLDRTRVRRVACRNARDAGGHVVRRHRADRDRRRVPHGHRIHLLQLLTS